MKHYTIEQLKEMSNDKILEHYAVADADYIKASIHDDIPLEYLLMVEKEILNRMKKDK